MLRNAALSVLLVMACNGFVACGKEDRKPDSALAEKQRDEAAAAEAEKRSSAITELATEQQFLDLKFKTTSERLEKQGNKTKKKLRPKFAALDAERAGLAANLEQLNAVPEPGFTEQSQALRARQDSLSRTLAVLEKSMK